MKKGFRISVELHGLARWTPEEICRFMRHRLATQGDEDVGVFAHKLPMAVGITPAAMPQAVQDWERQRGQKPHAPKGMKRPEESLVERQPKRHKAEKPVAAKSSSCKPSKVAAGHPERKEDIPSAGFSTRRDAKKQMWFLNHPSLKFEVPLESKGRLYQDEEGKPGAVAVAPMRGMAKGPVAAPGLEELPRLPAGDSTYS